MTTVYKVMDNSNIVCVCMTETECDRKVASLKRSKAKENLLVAAGLLSQVSSLVGLQQRLCTILNITDEQITAEEANVIQYSKISESI